MSSSRDYSASYFTHYFTLMTVRLLLLETTATSDLHEIKHPQQSFVARGKQESHVRRKARPNQIGGMILYSLSDCNWSIKKPSITWLVQQVLIWVQHI